MTPSTSNSTSIIIQRSRSYYILKIKRRVFFICFKFKYIWIKFSVCINTLSNLQSRNIKIVISFIFNNNSLDYFVFSWISYTVFLYILFLNFATCKFWKKSNLKLVYILSFSNI
jgi:hypothetical protein